MRACWRKPLKERVQSASAIDGGYHGGGVNNGQSSSAVSASPYFAARAFPIMRSKVTERPQQLPVDIFGYVRA